MSAPMERSDVLVNNSRIVTGDGQGVVDGWLLLRGGRIAGIGSRETAAPELGADAVRIDGEGGYALPGFIDVHVHGGGGYDFMTAGQAELETITRFHAENGTTAMLATTVTAPEDELTGVLRRVAAFREKPMPYAQLLGVHLEGPFLNPKWKGAQNAAHMVPPQPEWLERWTADFPGLIKIHTLAPEIEGSLPYIRELARHGIVAACGHTDATFEQLLAAADHGLTHAVHTYNAMRPLHHREPGTVGAVMTDSRIAAEVIADGEHVHPAAIRLLVQAKGVDGVILVTDAVAPAGMPNGEYDLGGLATVVKDGVARLKEGGSLAGSTLTTVKGFRYLVDTVGVTVEEASRIASLNPARKLGIADAYGSLEPGKRADVVLLDGRLELRHVLIDGRVVV